MDKPRIAIVAPQHPRYPAANAVLRGVQAALSARGGGFTTSLYDTCAEAGDFTAWELEERAFRAIQADPLIAGVICWYQEHGAMIAGLSQSGVPVVCIDRLPVDADCDFVGVDNASGAFQALTYLFDLGHRKIAHLTHSEATTAVIARRDAFLSFMSLHSLPLRDDWLCILPSGSAEHVHLAIPRLFDANERPTALFALNDALAHAFIAEAERLGYAIPVDMSVIGFDNLEQYSPTPAQLTSIHQPFDLIGQRAAEIVLQRIRQGAISDSVQQFVFLPTELIERASCRRLA